MNTVENLDDFKGWEELSSAEDFFSTLENKTDVEKAEDLKPVESKTEDSSEAKVYNPLDKNDSGDTKKEVLADNKDLFEVGEEQESESEQEKIENTSHNKQVINYLKEKEYFNFDEDIDFDNLSEEEIDDLIEDKFDDSVESKIEELFDGLPDVVKQFNQYVINGGNPMDFINQVYNTTTENIDDTSEQQQIKIVSQKLKAEGYDDDYIDSQIKFLQESGNLEKVAKKHINDIKKSQDEYKKELLQKQKEEEERIKNQIRENKREIENYVKNNTSVGDITLTKQDKKELSSYINDYSYKLQNGSTITTMQKELFYDVPKNKIAMMQLAVLMRNRNEDGTFNFDNIKKKVETQISKKIKEDVRRSKNIVPNDSEGKRQYSQKSLADYFD